MKTLERCKRKSQLRLRKLETEMITMMEKHAAQVNLLVFNFLIYIFKARGIENNSSHIR